MTCRFLVMRRFAFFLTAATLFLSDFLTLVTSSEKVQSLTPRNEARKLFSTSESQSCDSYNIQFPVTTETSILWTNGGGQDSEWINEKNWQFDYLPGVHKFNKAIMAANDVATVLCPATYMKEDISLEMRVGATLDVQADLTIGKEMVIKSNAEVDQSKSSHVTIGERLFLAASYAISKTAQLTIGTDLFMNSAGKMTINGDDTRILVSQNCVIQGKLIFSIRSDGSGEFDVGGELDIGATAILKIDASSYQSGTQTIQLIKASSVTGSFNPERIEIKDLSEELNGEIKQQEDGLYLEITGDGTKNPTSTPTDAPNPSPTTTGPTIPPSTPAPNTRSPTSSPVATTSSPTQHPGSGFVREIILTETGFDPITSNGICPFPDTSAIVINGAAYTAGPGTITLYDCGTINADFDLIDIRVEDFEEGLWFEIVYYNDSIDLVIKSLTDYSEYWARVRRTYKGDYPHQSSINHFPDFSWDTVPTWIRYRKNILKANFTSEELGSIATNHYLSWYGLSTPEHVIDMATRIKDKNDRHKMLLYWNSETYWGMDIDTFDEEWLEEGTSGTGGRRLYNHSIPEMRDWWVNHAKYMDEQDPIDGIFADNTRSPEIPDNQEGTIKSQMIRRLAEELPVDSLKMGNFLRQYDHNGNRYRMPYEDGSYFENQHKTVGVQPKHEGIVVSMQLAREASWKDKIVLWSGGRRNCGCATYEDDDDVPKQCKGFNNIDEEPTELITEDLHKSLGEFLMIVEEYSYFNFHISPDANCERWRWDSSGMPQFAQPLGRPKGPPIKKGNTFSRHFEYLSVKVDIKTEETTFIWHPMSPTALPTVAPLPSLVPTLSSTDAPTSAISCTDSPLKFMFAGKERTCIWAGKKKKCKKKNIQYHCPLTCGKCEKYKCSNSPLTFLQKDGTSFSCKDLKALSKKKRNKKCRNDVQLKKTCRGLCSYCDN